MLRKPLLFVLPALCLAVSAPAFAQATHPPTALGVSQTYTGTPTQTSVSCGTTSGTLLAAGAAGFWIHLENSPANANSVFLNDAGAPAVVGVGGIEIDPGQSKDYFASVFLPTAQINCIAAATTQLTVVYK